MRRVLSNRLDLYKVGQGLSEEQWVRITRKPRQLVARTYSTGARLRYARGLFAM